MHTGLWAVRMFLRHLTLTHFSAQPPRSVRSFGHRVHYLFKYLTTFLSSPLSHVVVAWWPSPTSSRGPPWYVWDGVRRGRATSQARPGPAVMRSPCVLFVGGEDLCRAHVYTYTGARRRESPSSPISPTPSSYTVHIPYYYLLSHRECGEIGTNK